jgi:hypothetical protein
MENSWEVIATVYGRNESSVQHDTTVLSTSTRAYESAVPVSKFIILTKYSARM